MSILSLMMGFLNSLSGLLAPLKVAFEALGRLFDRVGSDKAAAITQQAEALVRDVELHADFASKWFADMFSDRDALLKYWPGLVKLVYVAHNVRQSQNVDLHTALTAAQIEANVFKMQQR